MYATIRFLTAMLALAAGWVTGIFALLGVVWGVWLFLSGVGFLARTIAAPPPFIPLAVVAVFLPILFLGLSLVIFVCLPARWVMSVFVARSHTQRAPDGAAVAEECKVLAGRLNMRTPAVFVYASDALNAWALSTLFGSVVAVSSGLLAKLPPVQRQWVLAHELAHIKYFDSGAAAFWASSNRVVRFGWTVHHWLVNGTAQVLDALRLPFVVWTTLTAPLFVLSYALIAADVVARGVFRIVDRLIGRAMEYRADRVASRLVGVPSGIAVLSALPTGIAPSFGLFATHPTTQRRLRRLQRQAAPSANKPSAGAAPTPNRPSQAPTPRSGNYAARPGAPTVRVPGLRQGLAHPGDGPAQVLADLMRPQPQHRPAARA